MINRFFYFKLFFVVTLFCVFTIEGYSQEWRSLHDYQKQTGQEQLKEGNWLKKDRVHNTTNWVTANKFNVSAESANSKYTTIIQIRDFYKWFDKEIRLKGHEVNWVGIAAIAASNLAKLNNGWVKTFVVNDKELISFAEKGSHQVFEFAMPQLQQLYFSTKIIKGKEALDWDHKYGMIEQCEVLNQSYSELSEKATRKLQRMAEGKGIYCLGINHDLKFKGDSKDCKTRYEYSIDKLVPYYIKQIK